jgi:O-antigen ligase
MTGLIGLVKKESYFKIFVLGILICYLATTAMMLKFSDLFLIALFLIGLPFLPEFIANFKECSFFRLFTLSLWMVSGLVLINVMLYHDLAYLFTYRTEVFNKLIILPIVLNLFLSLRIQRRELAYVIILAGLYSVPYSLAVLIEAPVRGVGLLTGSIHRGSLAVIYAILGLLTFFYVKAFWAKVLALLVFIFSLFLSFQTGSKGGWVAIFLVMVSLFFYFLIYEKKRTKLYVYIALLVLSFAVLAFNWNNLPIAERLSSAYLGFKTYMHGEITEGSVGPRLEIWRAALLGISQSDFMGLIFGHGFMAFQDYFYQFIKTGNSIYYEIHPHPHNDYLKIVFEFGFLGLVIFSFIFIVPLYYLVRLVKRGGEYFNLILAIVLVEMMLEFMLTDKVLFVKSLLHTYLVLIFLIVIVSLQSDAHFISRYSECGKSSKAEKTV